MFHSMPDDKSSEMNNNFGAATQMLGVMGEWFLRLGTYLKREIMLGEKRMDNIDTLQLLAFKHHVQLGAEGLREFTELSSKMLDVERQYGELGGDQAESTRDMTDNWGKILEAGK